MTTDWYSGPGAAQTGTVLVAKGDGGLIVSAMRPFSCSIFGLKTSLSLPRTRCSSALMQRELLSGARTIAISLGHYRVRSQTRALRVVTRPIGKDVHRRP